MKIMYLRFTLLFLLILLEKKKILLSNTTNALFLFYGRQAYSLRKSVLILELISIVFPEFQPEFAWLPWT